jgi:Flp pilus assembly protein TadD
LPPGAVVQPLDDGPAGELRRSLTALAENPRSLEALVNAGRAALAMGDPQAALTFLSRAEEVSPGDPRVEAGMASAMVRVGQPRAALTLFEEAVAHGAPEAEIAADRGLAHDLSGETRLAQQDYNLALRRRDDPELRRRLALSLAISGQREAALRAIEPQIRRNERAAWRTQAFILALTGDTQGANRTARDVMPAGIAEAMSPFFGRLASLDPAQKAAAVHLGTFPSDGRSTAFASAAPPPATSYTPPAASAPTRVAEAEPVRERRRPGNVSPLEAAAVTGRNRPAPPASQPVRVAEAEPRRFAPPEPTRAPTATEPVVTTPVRVAQADTTRFAPPVSQPAAQPPPPSAEPAPSPRLPGQPPIQSQPTIATMTPPASQPALDAAASATPIEAPATSDTVSIASANTSPSPGFTLAPQPAEPPPASPPPAASAPSLSDIAALVRALPREEPQQRIAAATSPPAARPPARQPTTAPTTGRAERNAAPSEREIRAATARAGQRNTRARTPTPPANPSRHWVQVAGGANKATLGLGFASIRDRAPALLRGRTPYTTPLRATNRILVGPFRTPAEAQDFVNQLARSGVPAFAWTSEAGQEIERIQMPR